MQLLEAKAFSELTRIAGGLFLLASQKYAAAKSRPRIKNAALILCCHALIYILYFKVR